MLVTVIILAQMAVVLALNIAADPYRLFDTPEVPGWNALKPNFERQRILAKVVLLARAAPNTVLLGNSRIAIGFDPKSSRWPAGFQPVFNAAVAGADISRSFGILAHALAQPAVRHVVLGLEFEDFLVPGLRNLDDPVRASDTNWFENFGAVIRATLTLEAVLDSLSTFFDQDPDNTSTMDADGYVPLRDFNGAVREMGHHGLFTRKNQIYREGYKNKPQPDLAQFKQMPAFHVLAQMLEKCAAAGVEVTVILYPYHVTYYDIIDDAGLLPHFNEWKRVLTDVVADSGHGATVRLFDFSVYNPMTAETVPDEGDTKTAMQWYWEAGHFKSTLGDWAIDELTKSDAMKPTQKVSAYEITPSNVEERISAFMNSRRARSTALELGSEKNY